MMKRLTAIFAAALLLTGCEAAEQTPDAPMHELTDSSNLSGTHPSTAPDPSLADSGMAGKYQYTILNTGGGEVKTGYRLNAQEDALVVSISAGEHSTGGYGIYVSDLQSDGGNVTVTVCFTSPAPGEMVTEAFTYPGCGLKITPQPEHVTVRTESGDELPYLGTVAEQERETVYESLRRDASVVFQYDLKPDEQKAMLRESLDRLVHDARITEYRFVQEDPPFVVEFTFTRGGSGTFTFEESEYSKRE